MKQFNQVLHLLFELAFVEAYLASQDTLTKITDKMKQLLISLDAEPSQWETDQELNKGTKDYKITVKHRFDSNIIAMNGVEVYPFAASKKLYQVTDNTGGNGWVKASCGGSEVFDYWDDKKENEFYLINNVEEEKITGGYIAHTCDDGYIFNVTNDACELLPMPSAWFYSAAIYGNSSLGCWAYNFMVLYPADSQHFKSSWEVTSGGAILTFSQQPVWNCSGGSSNYAGIYWVAVADEYTTDPDRYAGIRHTVTSGDGRIITHDGSVRTSPIPR